jgi:transaldolase
VRVLSTIDVEEEARSRDTGDFASRGAFAVTNLHRLHDEFGQSPWFDDLTRDQLDHGELARLIDLGIRGVTANPTILARALAGSAAYGEQLDRLLDQGASTEDAFWELVTTDVVAALDLLRPVHDASGGQDGFVSLEVSPDVAYRTTATVEAAQRLHDRIRRPNLLVKIPATAQGIHAIREATARGLSINVTLIFSLERYAQAVEAYLSGLEELLARRGDPSQVRSVASFFVSRVDTEVARRLGHTAAGRKANGKVAIAQAQVAYRRFRTAFSGHRWEALAARGASPQRLLWASTSTKDPTLPDTLYVDALIGRDTITTLPEPTIRAFNDHGTLLAALDDRGDDASDILDAVTAAGVDLAGVGVLLEDQGVAAFTRSFHEALDHLHRKVGAAA